MSNYTISLSGLQNTNKALETVSTNIANANTVGYKAGEYVFADQFVKAINPADQARVGMGVKGLMVRRPMIQGTVISSSNPLDMAISGRGMFRMLKGSGQNDGSIDPSAVYYSRNGQFMVDKSGYIVNANGMYLTGYQPTLDKTGISDDLEKNDGLLRVPDSNLPGVKTTESRITTSLDSSGSAFTSTSGVEFDPTQNTFNNKTSQTVYDSEGASHTLELYYRRVADQTLKITSQSNGDGYTYSPSASSSPYIQGETKVTINPDSVLRVETAAQASGVVSTAASSSTTLVMSAQASNSGTGVNVTGMKVFVNGVDTGTTVTAGGTTATLTLSGNVTVPVGAGVSFYKPNVTQDTAAANLQVNGALTASKNLAIDVAASSNVNGYRLFTSAGVDLGVTVESGGDGINLVLSDAITIADNTQIEFRPSLNMTLLAPDGTELSVQGTTNKKNSGTDLIITNMAKFEVYASLDGRFYDYSETDVNSNRNLAPETAGVLGYRAQSELLFIGGRNIDSLFLDAQSGNPQFSTTSTLTASVTNQGGGVSNLVFELDLSDTVLQNGAFQVLHSVQNGEPVSRLTNVSIDSQGRIVGTYGTGKQQYVGQVALVDFENFEGLIPVGDNTFVASVQSGTEHSAEGVIVGRAGTGVFGDINSQALESSNVDLTNELVKLMMMQRQYTANSQGIRAMDSTVQDALRMGQ